MTNKALLKWQLNMGADEAITETPRNYFSSIPQIIEEKPVTVPIQAPSPAVIKMQSSPSLAASTAKEMADKATTLAELESAIRAFDGCALKKTAAKTVFADGNPKAQIMIIGEAPGAQEDLQGIPFCGPSGALLDRMFAAINMKRAEHLYISNTVYWRPPGNRQPSMEETTICLPFVEKHIALIAPKILILAGGTAAATLLRREDSISRLRGKTYEYKNDYMSAPVHTMVTYHPSYLLRQPAQKKLAWQDMLFIQGFLQA